MSQNPDEFLLKIILWGFSFILLRIDIAKNNHKVSIIDEKGKLLIESSSFSNFQKGYEKLFEKVEINTENIVIEMESTDYYWFSIYSFFIENNFVTKVINPF